MPIRAPEDHRDRRRSRRRAERRRREAVRDGKGAAEGAAEGAGAAESEARSENLVLRTLLVRLLMKHTNRSPGATALSLHFSHQRRLQLGWVKYNLRAYTQTLHVPGPSKGCPMDYSTLPIGFHWAPLRGSWYGIYAYTSRWFYRCQWGGSPMAVP